jgi:hypothetical protein
MGRQVIVCMLAACVGIMSGCASVVRREVRTERRVVSTRPTEQHPRGPLEVSGAQIVADRLAVRVQRVRLCRPAVVEGVVHQKVEDRTTQYDVLSMLGGLVVAGAGAGLLANVDDFSDTPGVDENGEETASSKDMAEVWGWVGVVGGALWALHGMSVAARAGAHDLPDSRKDEEERPTGGSTRCGFENVVSGELRLQDGEVDLASVPVGNTLEAFDLRAAFAATCRDALANERPLQLGYAVGAEPPVAIGIWDAAGCHHAALAGARLTEARRALDAAGPASRRLTKAADALASARDHVAALTADDRDRGTLQVTLDRMAAAVAEQSGAALDGALAEFERSLPAGDAVASARSARDVWALTAFLPAREAAVWTRLYGALVSSALPVAVAAPALDRIWSDADPVTGDCATEALSCSVQRDQAAVHAQLAPLATRLRADLDARRTAVEKALRALTARTSEASARALAGAITAAEGGRPLCARTWDEGLANSCDALERARTAATAALDERASVLDGLATARTAKAWRGLFPRCRQLAGFVDEFRSIGHCDAACKRTLALAQAELDRLATFKVEDGRMTDEVGVAVRSECQAARCPRCP